MGVSEKRKEKKSYGVEYPFKDTYNIQTVD